MWSPTPVTATTSATPARKRTCRTAPDRTGAKECDEGYSEGDHAGPDGMKDDPRARRRIGHGVAANVPAERFRFSESPLISA